MRVIVNGRRANLVGTKISYEQLIRLAYPNIFEPDAFTITFTYPGKDKNGGSLIPGQTVELDNGMVFNCLHTGQA